MRKAYLSYAGVALSVTAALFLVALPSVAGLAEVKPALQRLVRFQMYAWAIAVPVFVFALIGHRESALKYLRLNRFSGSMAPVRWLLIKEGENWRMQGWQFTLVLVVVTTVVISQQIPVQDFALSKLGPVLPWAFVLALSNSLIEELIFRHSIVSAFENGSLQSFAPLVSGLIFGCAHYFGAPGGFIGVLMAGFLGWLLAKSMQETGGIFWAWFIHACLDIVIFSAMLLQAGVV